MQTAELPKRKCNTELGLQAGTGSWDVS